MLVVCTVSNVVGEDNTTVGTLSKFYPDFLGDEYVFQKIPNYLVPGST